MASAMGRAPACVVQVASAAAGAPPARLRPWAAALQLQGLQGRVLARRRHFCAPPAPGAPQKTSAGPLAGVRVLDLTRVLAGPSCTQILGDLGAEVLKVERPGSGDDTRHFAPPFLPQDGEGTPSEVSAYFAGQNRNKMSLTVNYTKPEGREVIKRLLRQSDILVENFKSGTLDRYGLSYGDLRGDFPRLVYCSITGFGHTGPYAPRPGYDALIQAMGGIMSVTGAPEGEPMKVGLSLCDTMSGLHGAIGILAALRHAERTGKGQHVDIGMLDCNVAMLANQASNYLATGKKPPRLGNQHPNIVPYQVMPAADGHFILSVGNDPTFERFIKVAQKADPSAQAGRLLGDERFRTAVARVQHREVVTEVCNAITRTRDVEWWLAELEAAGVGCSPIQGLDQVFEDPQVRAREMVFEMAVPGVQRPARLVSSPLRLSETPPTYRRPPPGLGEHTESVLRDVAGYSAEDVEELQAKGAV